MVSAIQTMLVKTVALPIYKATLNGFEARTNHAQDIQNKFLLSHIRSSAQTQFGIDHGFSMIATIDDFKTNIPISSYSDLAPYIAAVSNGQTDALFPSSDKVICFCSTTGTTGQPKLIPVTQRWLNSYQRAWQLWGIKIFADHPELFDCIKSLQITGPGNLGVTKLGLPIGMSSALTARYQHPMIKPYFPVPAEVGDIKDPTARIYTILRIALPEPIGFIATITPSNLLRLAEVGDSHAQSLIRDIHDGTFNTALCRDGVLPDQLVAKLNFKNPRRAQQLEAIVKKTGTLYPKDYWPISLIACWLGGTVGYQTRSLAKYYGDVARRDLGFVSTEGRHTIPMHDDLPVGVLSFESDSYYEFVPAGEFGTPNATVLDGSQLDEGADYRILITSTNGLWRYDLGDIVRCNGHAGTAPLLEFRSKTKHVSDMDGEKLSGDQVALAIRDASAAVDRDIEHATFVPVRPPGEAPYYAVIVENHHLDGQPLRDHFLTAIDNSLIEQNVMYAGKRNDRFIGKPRLLQIPTGSWAKLIAMQSSRLKTCQSQYKHPPLITDPQWTADLESVVHTNLNFNNAPN